MKLKNILGVAALALVFAACKKESTVDTQSFENPQTEARNSGVVMDSPAEIAKVPVYVSSDFAGEGKRTEMVDPAAKGKPNADVSAPSVTITSPANGASVNGTVSVQVSASDNVGVKSVTLSINGSTVKSWTSAPYSYSWATGADGTYNLVAVAKDAAGNTATHSIVVSKTTIIIILPPPPAPIPSSYLMATPPIMNQGGEGSCLSMALSYQRSIEKYYQTNATSYNNSTNVMSPEFLYNQTKVASGCGSGAAMLSSMNFIINNGICSWTSLPYDTQNGCDASIITSAMRSEAMNNRIPTFHSILTSDATAIKTSLANNHPVSFTFQMDSNFYNSYPGYIWDSRGSLMFTHALTIVGYDDAKRAYKAINAWGSSWGDNGFIWIDYNFFPTIAGYVYTMN